MACLTALNSQNENFWTSVTSRAAHDRPIEGDACAGVGAIGAIPTISDAQVGHAFPMKRHSAAPLPLRVSSAANGLHALMQRATRWPADARKRPIRPAPFAELDTLS